MGKNGESKVSGANKYSSPMFHYEVSFWLLWRKYMLLIRVWVFYDKKMVVALVEKHSKQIFWKLKYFFSTPYRLRNSSGIFS